MPPLGQMLDNPIVVYVDLGFGINMFNSPKNITENSSSSNGQREVSQENESDSEEMLLRSKSQGSRGRGRRKAGIPFSHGMRTRRSSKKASQ